MEKTLIGRKVTIKDSGTPKVYTIVAYGERPDTVALAFGDKIVSTGSPLERLDLLPPTGLDAQLKGYQQTSGFRTTPDEATEWFVFCVLQAMDMFCNAAVDARDEIERLLRVRGEADGTIEAALAFYDTAMKHFGPQADDDA